MFRGADAGVAQSVEQRIRNAQVGGSSPFTSSKKQPHFGRSEVRLLLFLRIILVYSA